MKGFFAFPFNLTTILPSCLSFSYFNYFLNLFSRQVESVASSHFYKGFFAFPFNLTTFLPVCLSSHSPFTCLSIFGFCKGLSLINILVNSRVFLYPRTKCILLHKNFGPFEAFVSLNLQRIFVNKFLGQFESVASSQFYEGFFASPFNLTTFLPSCLSFFTLPVHVFVHFLLLRKIVLNKFLGNFKGFLHPRTKLISLHNNFGPFEAIVSLNLQSIFVNTFFGQFKSVAATHCYKGFFAFPLYLATFLPSCVSFFTISGHGFVHFQILQWVFLNIFVGNFKGFMHPRTQDFTIYKYCFSRPSFLLLLQIIFVNIFFGCLKFVASSHFFERFSVFPFNLTTFLPSCVSFFTLPGHVYAHFRILQRLCLDIYLANFKGCLHPRTKDFTR